MSPRLSLCRLLIADNSGSPTYTDGQLLAAMGVGMTWDQARLSWDAAGFTWDAAGRFNFGPIVPSDLPAAVVVAAQSAAIALPEL